MNAAAAGFRCEYARAFRAFLEDEAERSLRAAYELGREAVAREVGLLDFAQAHHEALLAELADASEPEELRRVGRAAADFLLEALSAYEMVRRGFTEALEVVALERRQAAMLRQLSSLLADASLAVHARSSIREVLQLVAEQARELTGAAWCVACGANGVEDAGATVAHAGSVPPALPGLARELVAAVEGTDSTCVVHVEARLAPVRSIAVPLTALDGRLIGVLAVAPEDDRAFSELDKALLVHIAQMTAAAVERAARYGGHGPRRSLR